MRAITKGKKQKQAQTHPKPIRLGLKKVRLHTGKTTNTFYSNAQPELLELDFFGFQLFTLLFNAHEALIGKDGWNFVRWLNMTDKLVPRSLRYSKLYKTIV